MENKNKSLLEQHYGFIAFIFMCLASPLGALILYYFYRLLRNIGLLMKYLITKVIQYLRN